jgi:hypothetical protein
MNPIAACAQRALREHPHPALRLSELVELISARIDRSLDAKRLRAELECHPDCFRLLDPWRGPWQTLRPADEDNDRTRDVWVVAVNDSGGGDGPAGPALKLRESVRWLGRGVDPRSPHEVCRWHAVALSERAARAALTRRAA